MAGSDDILNQPYPVGLAPIVDRCEWGRSSAPFSSSFIPCHRHQSGKQVTICTVSASSVTTNMKIPRRWPRRQLQQHKTLG
jgi:hypothetical protein